MDILLKYKVNYSYYVPDKLSTTDLRVVGVGVQGVKTPGKINKRLIIIILTIVTSSCALVPGPTLGGADSVVAGGQVNLRHILADVVARVLTAGVTGNRNPFLYADYRYTYISNKILEDGPRITLKSVLWGA